MPESWFLRGLIVAVVFGVPAGAIGALTVSRTLRGGFLAGFATGLGSTVADIAYACVGAFGLSVISGAFIARQTMLRIASGFLLVIMGVVIFRKRTQAASSEDKPLKLISCFASSFVIAIANPATILSFFTAFAALGLKQSPGIRDGVLLVSGIGFGAVCWWAVLAGAACAFHRKMTEKTMTLLNRILGSLLILFGLYTLIQTVLLK